MILAREQFRLALSPYIQVSSKSTQETHSDGYVIIWDTGLLDLMSRDDTMFIRIRFIAGYYFAVLNLNFNTKLVHI